MPLLRRSFSALGKQLPTPSAILCISAHWLSNGSWVTAMEQPKTIHDFSGFPPVLHEFQYPAKGSPTLAMATSGLLEQHDHVTQLDKHEWGLDHGSWSVLTHLYPDASVPVVQLSLDYYKSPEQHYQLAKDLAVLRNKGVLIVGSGNLVHNLRLSGASDMVAFDWAIETDEKIKQFMQNANHKALINYHEQDEAFKLAIPTNEHYLPVLYALALQDKQDDVLIFNDKITNGAISMTSVAIGV